jgi:type IV secretory pathway protease TraF
MLEEIGAVPGDRVELKDGLLFINAESTAMAVSSEDSRGNALRAYPTPLVLQPGCYWLISVPRGGFGSRYFGPVHRSAFTHRARRVF